MKQAVISFFLTLFLFSIACGEKDKVQIESIRGIKIDESREATVGDTIKLTVVTIPDENVKKFQVKWESSDSSIVDIDKEDRIIALKEGRAIIYVSIVGKKNISSQCKITVNLDMNALIEFEDDLFKSAVLFEADKNQDGEVQQSEALAIKDLRVAGQTIKSLKGIEHFKNLKVLVASLNRIKEVDLSKNHKLRIVDLNNNLLSTIHVSGLKELEELYCRSNLLQDLDVTHNPVLKKLDCSMNLGGINTDHNGIRKIDVTQNPELEYLNLYFLNISELDVTKNPKLKWLDFSLSGYGNMSEFSPIQSIDLSQNTMLEHLACEGWSDPGKCLQSLDISSCPNLTFLACYGNTIKSLDISNNKKLEHLNIAHNPIEKLDVSNNVLLEMIYCERCNLKKLDLSKNANLTFLRCAYNEIDKLDFSNTAISYVEAHNNKISEVNMGTKIFNTLDDKGKPYLYLKLNDNQISSLDVRKQENLAWLEIKNNNLSELDVSGCTNLGGLLCSSNNIHKLLLGTHSRMWELRVAYNQLVGELDISHLNNLSKGSFEGNPGLKEIKINKALNPDCTYYLSDHTTGFSGSLPCYTKDGTANWSLE